jgi:hypothetical protein
MKNANLEAIKAKRGHGLNISILLGEKEHDGKPSDEMAPEATELDEHGASPVGTKDHDMKLKQMMAEEESTESPEEKAMELKNPDMEEAELGEMERKLQAGSDQEMMKHMDMNEYVPNHKPRSIGERAKAALMMRMKK